jgi:hypothetical protein
MRFAQDPDDPLFAVTRFLHGASFLRWKPILSNYVWCEFPEAGQNGLGHRAVAVHGRSRIGIHDVWVSWQVSVGLNTVKQK